MMSHINRLQQQANGHREEQQAKGRLPLRRMQKNQSGIIATVKAEGELGLRIREMGLVPGTRITVQGRAPLHDPMALRVLGCTLTLRNNEADYIAVDVD